MMSGSQIVRCQLGDLIGIQVIQANLELYPLSGEESGQPLYDRLGHEFKFPSGLGVHFGDHGTTFRILTGMHTNPGHGITPPETTRPPSLA